MLLANFSKLSKKLNLNPVFPYFSKYLFGLIGMVGQSTCLPKNAFFPRMPDCTPFFLSSCLSVWTCCLCVYRLYDFLEYDFGLLTLDSFWMKTYMLWVLIRSALPHLSDKWLKFTWNSKNFCKTKFCLAYLMVVWILHRLSKQWRPWIHWSKSLLFKCRSTIISQSIVRDKLEQTE